MSFTQYIKLALLSIKSSKVRSFLTILGIIIGIASVVIMIGLGNGTRQTIEDSFSNIGVNTLTIYAQFSGPIMAGTISAPMILGEKDLNTIRNAESLRGRLDYISPEYYYYDQAIAGKYNEFVPITGVESSYQQIKGLKLKVGSFITARQVQTNARVVVLGSNIADKLFPNTNPVGKTIRVKSQVLKVIGVLESLGAGSFYQYDDSAMVPITTTQNLISGDKNYSNIVVKVTNREEVDAVKAEIEYLLAVSRKELDPDKRTFMVQSSNQIIDEINNVTAGFTAFMLAIASIALVVGAIGITNTMIATISERTKEIGLRKAVGARNSDIRVQFLVESTVLTLLGGIFGVLLALLLSVFFNTVLNNATQGGGGFGQSFRVIIDLKAALLAAIVSCVVGIISGLYPAVKAARLNPIEALRYE